MAANTVGEGAVVAPDGEANAPLLIVVACTGNRGRSPAVEAMLRARIARAGLTAAVTVASGGLCAFELGRAGMTADPAMIDACAEVELDISSHVVRPLTPDLIDPATLVIVMERWQVDVVRRGYKEFTGEVHTLPQLDGATGDVEIEDPAGLSSEQLRSFVDQAQDYLDRAMESGPLKEVIDAARRRER